MDLRMCKCTWIYMHIMHAYIPCTCICVNILCSFLPWDEWICIHFSMAVLLMEWTLVCPVLSFFFKYSSTHYTEYMVADHSCPNHVSVHVKGVNVIKCILLNHWLRDLPVAAKELTWWLFQHWLYLRPGYSHFSYCFYLVLFSKSDYFKIECEF